MKTKHNFGGTLLMIFLSLMTLLFIVSPACAKDKDDEESLMGKAASQLLESMPDFFRDITELQKMTDQERVNYVLTKAEERIKEKVADKFKEDMLEKAKKYVKASFRAKLFLEIGVPKIRHAYAMGKAFDWSLINSEIESKLDTKMEAFSAGIKTVKIGWAAYEAYSEGDLLAAGKSISGKISDLLAEAYIPGWSYYKIGVAMVEALGNYVLSYATETALQGMLEDMYGIRSNPEGFAKWLIDKTPAQIDADVRDKWQLVFGRFRLYPGRATDKGDEEMINRIKETLISMRGELLVRKKEQEQKERQIQTDLVQKYLDTVRATESSLKNTAQIAKGEADKYLSKIEEFKNKIRDIKKEKTRERAQMAEVQITEASSKAKSISINPGEILSFYERYFSEIKEPPATDGYDSEKMALYLGEASAKRKQNIERAEDDLESWYISENRRRNFQLTEAELNFLSEQFRATRMKLSGEIALLEQDIKLMEIEADKRFATMGKRLREGIERISKGIKEANREFNERLSAWAGEVRDRLTLPELVLRPEYLRDPGRIACFEICGFADRASEGGRITRSSPGTLYSALSQAKDMSERLKSDANEVGPLFNKKISIYKKYQADILSLHAQFKSLVPNNLQFIPATIKGDKQTWRVRIFDYQTLPIEIPVNDFDQFIAELIQKNKIAQQSYRQVIEYLEKNISNADYYATLDAIAVSINRIAPSLIEELKKYYYKRPRFNIKNNVEGYDFPASESDGAKYLAEMKNFWKVNTAKIEKFQSLKKAYDKGIEYLQNDPSRFFEDFDFFVREIPGLITKYEKAMEEAEELRLKLLAGAGKALKELQDSLAALKSHPVRMFEERRINNLKEQLTHYLRLASNKSSSYYPLRDRFLAFQEEFEQLLTTERYKYYEKFLKESAEAQKRVEEEQRKKQEEALKRQQEERVALLTRENHLVKEFYNQFKQAYESRNDSLVMSFMGDQWRAEDGTTLSDLRVNLNRSFKTFDEIRYNIQNLNIERIQEGIYRVSYDVAITSRIFRRNIKHSEKSSVIEEVIIDNSGKVKIFRTLSGRYWY